MELQKIEFVRNKCQFFLDMKSLRSSRYKNFRCEHHDKFFEVNLYQNNPINSHHWRVNLARPSRDIDLAFRTYEHEIQDPSVGGKKSEHLTNQNREDPMQIQYDTELKVSR